jgi:hypothetical protein
MPLTRTILRTLSAGGPALGTALLLALCGCHATSAGSGSDLGHVPPLSLENDLRIGSRDDPDLGFTRPIGVDVDADGNVYVAEASTMEIRVYSPDGGILRRFGRRGDGPGEFQGIRFGVKGDTVWVFDMMAQRITLFDRQGKLLSARRITPVTMTLPPRGVGYVLPWRMRSDGLFTSSLSMISFVRGTPEASVPDSVPVPRVLFDANGTVVDTVGWDEKPPPRMWQPPGASSYRSQLVRVGDRQYMVPSPPPATPVWLSLDDGEIRVTAPIPESPDQGIVDVTRVGLSRDTVYDRHLTFKPIPYSSAELDSIAALYARSGGFGAPLTGVVGGSGPQTPDDVEALRKAFRDAMEFPDFHPGIQYPWLDQDNRVWLRLDRVTGARSSRWVILDTGGEPLGAVDLPATARILWSRGDAFWAVIPDEMDVPWLVRYRMGEPRDTPTPRL